MSCSHIRQMRVQRPLDFLFQKSVEEGGGWGVIRNVATCLAYFIYVGACLFLHAHAVEFVWPDSEEVFAVSAPLPEELSAVSDALNRQPVGRRGQRSGPGGRAKAR